MAKKNPNARTAYDQVNRRRPPRAIAGAVRMPRIDARVSRPYSEGRASARSEGERVAINLLPMRPTVQDGSLLDQRWRQIVEAAVPLFISKGFHATTTREIARAVGMSIGTLYEYVRSKEDVLLLVCHYIHSDFEAALRQALREEGTVRERLAVALRALIGIVDRLQDYVVLTYRESKALGSGRTGVLLRREEAITSIFADLIREGIDAGEFAVDPREVRLLAHTIMVLGEMWAFRRWALRHQYSLAEYTEHQVRHVLDRLRAPSPEPGVKARRKRARAVGHPPARRRTEQGGEGSGEDGGTASGRRPRPSGGPARRIRAQ